jgi:hypothetical protein
MKEINFFGDIRDEEILNKFNGEYQASATVESASDVLKRIAGKDSWNQKDEVVLANTSVEEYYQLFKNERGEHLSSYINTCLKFGQFGNVSDQQKEISNRVTEVLKRIAAESELNKLRVKKYGVKIDT